MSNERTESNTANIDISSNSTERGKKKGLNNSSQQKL